jgi:3-methylcrotonyl-CoA carboxylase alpha subunit
MGAIKKPFSRPFNRILIANRGEISCRIQKTCQRLGIETVAIGSGIDATAAHMEMANIAVVIGEDEAQGSYLNGQAIIQAALNHNAEAIHPGYGFLSENPEFAQAVRKAGLVFVGPSVEAIEKMGSKSSAKQIAEGVKVPTIPGFAGRNHLKKAAKEIGLPLLIKATYGGGGKGMRCVYKLDEFDHALAACQREAKLAFGYDDVMLEKYLIQPRHIEVQILADRYGKCIALSDRDCSLQRRHQKVIEEAPASHISKNIREKLHHAAVLIAKDVKYESVGTVEFLVNQDDEYYFLEMNTRLQVEHPVTELVLGLDLVEWQLRIAAGEPLSIEQKDIKPCGYAIEARLYAEDGENNFLPSTGKIIQLDLPKLDNVRIDTGVRLGDAISIYYDPMIAKIIAWGESRTEAIQLLQDALFQTEINGLKTNLHFLQDLISDRDIQKASPDIEFIDRFLEKRACHYKLPEYIYLLAAVWLYQNPTAQQDQSIWQQRNGWRLNYPAKLSFSFEGGETISVVIQDEALELRLREKEFFVQEIFLEGNTLSVTIDGMVLQAKITQYHNNLRIHYHESTYRLSQIYINFDMDHQTLGSECLVSPMPGRIVSIMVALNQPVLTGQSLMILEAMKMEHTIRAPYDGIIDYLPFAVGDVCEEGVELVRLKER